MNGKIVNNENEKDENSRYIYQAIITARPRAMGIHPTSVVTAVGGGLAMGTLHVVTGADHISAVASLSVGNTSHRAFWLGARWGAGHSVGLLCVFLTLMALRVETNEVVMQTANRWMGVGVGLFMIALGVYGIYAVDQRLMDAAKNADEKDEGDEEKLDDEKKPLTSDDNRTEKNRKPEGFLNSSIAVLVGVVHGAAGPGAVLGVLPAMALRDAPLVWGYFVGFIVATVLSMGVFAACWGTATRKLGEKGGAQVQQNLALFSSVLCVVVGVAWGTLAVLDVEMN